MSVQGMPPFGYQPETIEFEVTNRTGVPTVKDDVYQLALDQADGDVSNNNVGSVNSGWSNIIASVAAAAGQGQVCVVASAAVANDARLMVTIRGQRLVTVDGTTDVVSGDALETDASAALIRVTNATGFPCAIALAARTANSQASVLCYFDGLAGAFNAEVS